MSRDDESIERTASADETQVIQVAGGTIGAIMRSEVEAQLDAAHKYKRSVSKFLQDATGLATINRDIAESCMYSLPRGGKPITGPSVRLAEIIASAYGNLQFGARVIDAEEKEIVAQGVCWDMERNNRCTIETRRRITDSKGHRYKDDMITVTGNAAASIALRNAIFRVVPRAYVDIIYAAARKVAVGDAKSFSARRDELMGRLLKMGVTQERVLARLGRTGVADITMEDAEILIGLGTAIKNNDTSLDEAFPDPTAPAAVAPAAGQEGRRISLKGNGKKGEAKAESPPASDPAHAHDPATGELPYDPPGGEEDPEPGSNG